MSLEERPAPAIPLEHPGIILREEFLEHLSVSAYRLSKDVHVPKCRITVILRGERAISADTALRFARYVGTSVEFWTDLQARYDLGSAVREKKSDVEGSITPLVAAH